jgi:hypothetical protein
MTDMMSGSSHSKASHGFLVRATGTVCLVRDSLSIPHLAISVTALSDACVARVRAASPCIS